MSKYSLLLCLLLVLTPCAFGQDLDPNYVPEMKDNSLNRLPRVEPADDFVVAEVRGSIKATARYLPKPYYPEEARKAGIDGVVRVRVTVNESGDVTGATMESGNEVFREVAQTAARRSKFRIADGTRTEGVLSYLFEIRRAGWARIGSDLRRLELAADTSVSIPVMIRTLDASWAREHALLESLLELSLRGTARPTVVRTYPPSQAKTSNGMSGSSMAVAIMVPVSIGKAAATSAELISAIQARLAGDPLASWAFDLGLNLVTSFYSRHAVPSPRNPGFSTISGADLIARSLENKPAGVGDEVIAALRTLETSFRAGKSSKDDEVAISKAIVAIISVR